MGADKIQDGMNVKDLLANIGKKKKWSEKDIKNDFTILEKNRIFTVNDLKSLSRESWSQIDLLPLVKDLLRLAIDPDWRENDQYQNKQSDEKKEKKEKKKDKKKNKKKKESDLGEPVVPTVLVKESNLLCEDPVTIENTIKNGTASSKHVPKDSETDSEEDDDDEPVSPSNNDDVPVRRKSVTFSDENTFIDAVNIKKEGKKSSKKSPTVNTGYNNFKSHPYTNQPTLKFKKLKIKHTRLPPVPDNDTFLQGLHDKLMANRIEKK